MAESSIYYILQLCNKCVNLLDESGINKIFSSSYSDLNVGRLWSREASTVLDCSLDSTEEVSERRMLAKLDTHHEQLLSPPE